MEALFVLLFVIGYMLIFVGAYEAVSEKIWRLVPIVFGIMLIVFAVLIIGRNNPQDIETSKFSIRTEIRTTSLNGIETERDTVYIFTKKK